MKEEILSLGSRELRLDFTIESGKEVKEILQGFNQVFNENKSFNHNFDFTRGHLKRGVE